MGESSTCKSFYPAKARFLALLQSLWLIFCRPLLSRNGGKGHSSGDGVMALRFLLRSATLYTE